MNLLSCFRDTRDSFPDIRIKDYNSKRSAKLSELIGNKPRLLIWIPLENCGICVRETMDALAEFDGCDDFLVVTSSYGNNPLRKWIAIYARKHADKIRIHHWQGENLKSKESLRMPSKIMAFVLGKNLRIYRKVKMPGTKISIYKKSKNISKDIKRKSS